MGSIFQQDGKWRAQVELPPGPDGERNRTLKSFDTKQAAEEWLAEMTHRAGNGEVVNPSRMTLRDWLTQWGENHAKPDLKKSTWTRYEGIIRNHIVPELGSVVLGELTPYHLKNLYNKKLKGGRADEEDGGLSKSSVHQMHAILHRALREAAQLRMIESNPAAEVDPPQPEDKPPEHLDRDQVQRFLEVAEQMGTYYEAYYLAVHTGLRRGELLGLRWTDVDLDERQLSVAQTLMQDNGGDLYFDTPKTKHGRRTLALSEPTVEFLEKHQLRQKEQRLKLGPAWPGTDLVFRAGNGKPIRPRNLYRHYRKVLRKAGLPKVSFHALRHTHATLLLKQGTHPKIVKERLGHGSITVTLDTYSHVSPNMQQEAADQLGGLLQNSSG